MLHSIRRLATTPLSVGVAPQYTLASIRSFPSLEPHTMAAYPKAFLDHPLRRDLLWSAVVYEADRARVGSGNVPTKGDKLFSNRKLHPQKGSGRARVGDANSPIRFNGIKAHGIKAPHDWSTKLPNKVYSRAVLAALSQQYRLGQLFVVGGQEAPESDRTVTDFEFRHPEQMRQFTAHHGVEDLNLVFITDIERRNLVQALGLMGKRCDVLVKEAVEVRDLLRAHRVYIEQAALDWFVSQHTH